MGTGFSLDDTDNPVEVLRFLNDVAVEGAKSGIEDRPVGNMATISVHHPKIQDIVNVKVDSDKRNEEWKFNISINASGQFMAAAVTGEEYRLEDGTNLNARDIALQISESARICGDPGLVFIDRLNRDNPTPGVGEYVSTAPCAEVGLTPGESCQFGYINLGMFVDSTSNDSTINWGVLEKSTRLMTRALDNALEISIDSYAHPANSSVMRAKRKIGIGICGLADMLAQFHLPYESMEARIMIVDVLSYINYISKLESHELAKTRGSFGAMNLLIGNRYLDNPGFIEQKYGDFDTNSVRSSEWRELANVVRSTRLLRNASTIALPPTGRSGLVIDASTGVEPYFTLLTGNQEVNPFLLKQLNLINLSSPNLIDQIKANGRIGNLESIPFNLRKVFQTAVEITPFNHLNMVAELQLAVDESISKTVNLPSNSTAENILDIYSRAYELGLKGITIFTTGSREHQPVSLGKK